VELLDFLQCLSLGLLVRLARFVGVFQKVSFRGPRKLLVQFHLLERQLPPVIPLNLRRAAIRVGFGVSCCLSSYANLACLFGKSEGHANTLLSSQHLAVRQLMRQKLLADRPVARAHEDLVTRAAAVFPYQFVRIDAVSVVMLAVGQFDLLNSLGRGQRASPICSALAFSTQTLHETVALRLHIVIAYEVVFVEVRQYVEQVCDRRVAQFEILRDGS
jgi:hypothetical protein